MKHWPRLRKAAICAIAAGAFLPGCLANFQNNVDLLFGSDALGNAMRLPYTWVGALARALLSIDT